MTERRASVPLSGSEAIAALVDRGRALGLEAVTEYRVPGGRLDVVWLWRPPSPLPGLSDPLPIAGFEVESSWRTRKHIKGDLVNLQDLACSLGVIVLLGDGEEVEATRRFASQLVARPGCRILVWSEVDIAELFANAEPLLAGSDDVPYSKPVDLPPAAAGSTRPHTGKYQALWSWLISQQAPSVTVSFNEVERLLGFALPPSCRRHLPHWYGYDNTAVGRAIRDAGWRARNVSLQHEMVTFEREGHEP